MPWRHPLLWHISMFAAVGLRVAYDESFLSNHSVVKLKWGGGEVVIWPI